MEMVFPVSNLGEINEEVSRDGTRSDHRVLGHLIIRDHGGEEESISEAQKGKEKQVNNVFQGQCANSPQLRQ